MRFPEFDKKYKNGELGEFIHYATKKTNLNSNNLYVSTENILKDFGGLNPIYPEQNIRATEVLPNNILMSNIRPYLKKIELANFNGGCSSDVLCFDVEENNPLYIKFLMQQDSFIDYVMNTSKGTKMPRGDKKSILKYRVSIPSKIEQENISSAIYLIENKINLIECKIENLKLFKKGLSQQLFTKSDESEPILRVNGFKGEWKMLKVGNLLIERNLKSPKSEEFPLMSFVANVGVTKKGERFNREFLVNDEDGKKYKQTEYDDFIYSSNNLTTGSIGLNKYGKASISPVYSIFFPTELTSSDFVSNLLVRDYFINQMTKYRQGVVYGQWRIHESDFLNIDIRIPDLEEQQEILKLVNVVERKIVNNQNNLQALKEFNIRQNKTNIRSKDYE